MNVNVSAQASPGDDADARPLILVVDDVADNRDILTRRLVRRGFRVIEACNGTEALEIAGREAIDLILLDIMMPDILGTEVVRELRKTHPAWELPIIMVSAKSQSDDVAESLEAGANDYVIKPVDFTVALARIQTQLDAKTAAAQRRHRSETEQRRLQEEVEKSGAEVEKANRSLLQEAVSRKRSDEKLAYLAYHDTLTGLANRSALLERMDWALADPEMRARDPALLFVDLDRFKAVNDVHGHAVGDQVLRAAARRLEGSVAAETLSIARLGGDEFAVLLPTDGDPEAGAATGRRIVEALSRPIVVDDVQAQIGASCGVAYSSLCGGESGVLIKSADLAMYRAKTTGRGRTVTFDASILEAQRNRSFLEMGLLKALRNNEFSVYYQPLVEAGSQKLVGFEALARWHHPERGLIMPEDFIPVAEDTGLITDLGAWVLRTACRAARDWPGELSVAVNLSPVQFRQPDLIDLVRGALEESAIAPGRLELEITESCLLDAGDANMRILTTLRELGIRIAIDDFGTGYSSMSYLQKFEFDKLKIDRRFVSDIDTSPTSAAIIDAIVQLGARLGISTTIEGVETEAQLSAAVAHGCREVQGFLVSVPIPCRNVMAFIEDHLRAAQGDQVPGKPR